MDASWAPLDVVRDPLTYRSAAYLLVSMGFGLAWFITFAVGFALSVGLLIIWVGLAVFALLMIWWRLGAILERFLMKAAFGVTIPAVYRALPPGRNFLLKWRTMVGDPATWKDLLYLGLLFPIAMAEFIVSVAIWATTLLLLLAPFIAATGQRAEIGLGGGVSVIIEEVPQSLALFPLGLLSLMLSVYAVRVMAIGHVLYARFLLGPSGGQEENQVLRKRAEHLRASRARGVDAAEAERRRIERDLHDGAQQRLLAVAMDIGRARARLDDDPAAARELIEQAHAGTKEAIAELRALARGIYPAILTDRGLDPALSGLAARAPLPVEVTVDLPDRPPAAVESIAYFIVAESLANIAKHARATRATVHVGRDARYVVVEVTDNGVGGAVAAHGGGLAGLADRAATIDGILTVNSPLGGPTVIRADLPCAW